MVGEPNDVECRFIGMTSSFSIDRLAGRGVRRIVAALVLGGAATALGYLEAKKRERHCWCGMNLVPVLVAAHDIPAGTVILPAYVRHH
jgi:hypothetical protein